jgi:hypothetical protein
MLTFKQWLKEEEKYNLEDLVGHSIYEDIYDDYDELKRKWPHLSPSTRASIKKDLIKLEKLLRTHNWNWQYEKNNTIYKKGRDQEQEIRNIVIDILKDKVPDAFDLYKKYAKKAGVKVKYFESLSSYSKFINEDTKATYNLKHLEKMLRDADHYYMYSDDFSAYKKGEKQQKEIQAFIKKVGKQALIFYNRWMKQQGLTEKGFLECELVEKPLLRGH